MSIEEKIKKILDESKTTEVIEEDAVVVEEETVTDGVTKVEGDNEENKTNNVDKQEIGGKTKVANVVTKNASAPETTNLTSCKEDVDALIDGEELTEAFKEKAATIFEAAVMNRVKIEVERLNEANDVKLVEQVELIKEGLVEKVDGYLDYVVERWIEQNEIALENGMKTEILESFVGGMKSLFEEHYIDIPEEKYDVLGSLEEQIKDVRAKLDEQLAANVELNSELASYQVTQIISELSEGLVATDKEKFNALVEELEFEGEESFRKKVRTIRESYFTNKATKTIVESVISDTPILTEDAKYVAPQMRGYMSALDNLK